MTKHLSSKLRSASNPRRLLSDTHGAGLVEYIILVGLIALAAVMGFRHFGTSVNSKAVKLGDAVRDLQ